MYWFIKVITTKGFLNLRDLIQTAAWPQLPAVQCVNVKHIQTRELQMFYCRGLLIMTTSQADSYDLELWPSTGTATGIWCDYDG